MYNNPALYWIHPLVCNYPVLCWTYRFPYIIPLRVSHVLTYAFLPPLPPRVDADTAHEARPLQSPIRPHHSTLVAEPV